MTVDEYIRNQPVIHEWLKHPAIVRCFAFRLPRASRNLGLQPPERHYQPSLPYSQKKAHQTSDSLRHEHLVQRFKHIRLRKGHLHQLRSYVATPINCSSPLRPQFSPIRASIALFVLRYNAWWHMPANGDIAIYMRMN